VHLVLTNYLTVSEINQMISGPENLTNLPRL